MCPKPDRPDDIHSAVENENTYLLTLQVSRYCPLVLQSCTVAAVPVMEHRVCRYLWCVMASLVEYDTIKASHLDGPGRYRHLKFEVVLYRGVDVFPVIRGLKHVKSELILYMASHYTRGYTVAQTRIIIKSVILFWLINHVNMTI